MIPQYGEVDKGDDVVKTDFRQMRYLIKRLPMARLNVDRALSRSARMTAQYSDMPRGGNKVSDPTAEGTILYMAAKTAYEQLQKDLKAMQDELEPKIEKLRFPLWKLAMNMRYIEGHSAREIAYYLNYSEQHIFWVLSHAEKEINKESEP